MSDGDDDPSKLVVYGGGTLAGLFGVVVAVLGSIVLGDVIVGTVGGALVAGVGYKLIEVLAG